MRRSRLERCRVGQRSRMSPDASPSRRLNGCNRRAHHAILLTLGPLVAEADLLEEAARGAIEELGPHLLALQVVRIALSTTPPPAFAIRSRAPRTATAATPFRR